MPTQTQDKQRTAPQQSGKAPLIFGGLAALILLFSLGTILYLWLRPREQGPVAEILQGSTVILQLDLSKEKDRDIRIECPEGYNVVSIRNGEVSVSEADCPDKVCMLMGPLTEDFLPIVCLPHGLVIRFSEEQQ